MAYKEFRLTGGLNLKASQDLVGEGELIEADGCAYDELGAVCSEKTPTKITSSQLSGAGLETGWERGVKGIGEAVANSTRYLFAAGGSHWSRLPFDGGTPTQILGIVSGFTKNRLSVVGHNAWAYLANGYRFVRYDGGYSGLLGAIPTANAGGTGYVVGDILTIVGGTYSSQAQVTVSAVSASGAVQLVRRTVFGEYTTFPASPNSATGGSGTGVSLDLYFGSQGSLERVGCAIPDAPSSPTEVSTGNSIAGTSYKYVVTFFNGVAESNFSDPLSYTVVGNSKSVQITIPTDSQISSGTISRRVYRTDNNGVYYYFVGEVSNNTDTTFTDPMGLPESADPDASSGDEATNEPRKKPRFRNFRGSGKAWSPVYNPSDPGYEREAERFGDERVKEGEFVASNLGWLADWTDHDQPPDGENTDFFRDLMILNDVVYAIDRSQNLNFSKPLNAEHWPIWNQVKIGEGYNSEIEQGEKLQQILPLGADVICYTTRGVWKFTRQGTDALQSRLDQLDSRAGVFSTRSATTTEDLGHFFLSKDGIYNLRGGRVTKVSTYIEKLFTDSSNSDYVDPDLLESAVAGSYDKYLLFSYRTTGATYNNRTIRLDLSDDKPKWSVSQRGWGSLYRDSSGRLIAGSNGSEGGGTPINHLYVIDGNGDSTSSTWTVQSGFEPMRSRMTGERPSVMWVDADFAGISTTISLIAPDGTTIDSFTSSANGRQRIKRLIPYGNTYDSMSLKVQSTGVGDRKLYGWALATDEAAVD